MKEVKNTLLSVLGAVLTVVGIVAVILPLVPGTPLLLLAAACFGAIES
ncbi:MAG: hypothetical protein Q6J74_02855 [Gloeomargarita sp. DG02_1_bins_92]